MGKRSLANFAKNMALIAAVRTGAVSAGAIAGARGYPGTGSVPVQWALRQFRPEAGIAYAAAYAVSPDVFACVSLIAETLATLDLDLYVGDGDKRRKLEEAPMNPAERWDRPNAHDDEYTFGEALAANLMTFGNGYILKDRMGVAGPPREITVLCGDTSMTRPIPGPNRTIAKYQMWSDGRWKDVATEDMVHIKLWNPDPTDPIGLSPMSAAMLAIQSKRNGDKMLDAMMQTGGGMPGIFSVKEAVSPEQEEAFLERLRAKWRNFARLFEPDFFPGDMAFHPTSNTLAEMEFVELNKLSAAQVAKVYRVPPTFVGVKDGGGLSDAGAKTDMLLFWEHRMRPLLKRIERALDKGLWSEWRVSEGKVTCKFDLSAVLPLVEVYLDHAKAMVEVTGGPLLLTNEGREKLGDEDLDDAELEQLKEQSPRGQQAQPSSTGDPAPAVVPAPAPAGTKNGNKRPKVTASKRLSRDTLHEAAEIQLERAQAQGERVWKTIIEGQHERVQGKLLGIFGEAGRVIIPDVEEVIAAIEDDEDRREVETFLQRLVEATGQGAIDTIPDYLLARAVGFDMQARMVRQFLKENIDRAIIVPNDTTRRLLRMSLADGVQRGETLSELSNRVQEVFDVRRANTATIARTEALSALNFAAIEGYAQSGAVDEVEWATSRDEMVRGNKPHDEWSHVVMDRKVVKIGDLWTVPRNRGAGSETLRRPGDPKGSAGNIINCRCRVLPVIRTSTQRRTERQPLWWDRAAVEGHAR
jgi:HK97 family phage portal protein